MRSSFIPPEPIRELRDLTRRRKKLLSHLSSEKNRIQKVLDTAGVKMGNVISDVFGVSGQGPALRRLEWKPVEETEPSRRPLLGIARIAPHHPVPRRDDGGIDLERVTAIRILEVVNYHGS